MMHAPPPPVKLPATATARRFSRLARLKDTMRKGAFYARWRWASLKGRDGVTNGGGCHAPAPMPPPLQLLPLLAVPPWLLQWLGQGMPTPWAGW
jgi:hypothetical protein